MKRAVQLEENCFLNMDSIILWTVSKNRICITSNDPELQLEIEVKDDSSTDQYPLSCITLVNIQDFHRIKREIEQYMGIDSPHRLQDELREA